MERAGKRPEFMNTTQDFAAVLAAVSRATGIPEAWIFTKRKGQIYCDARWIAVRLMTDLGYYPGQIADATGLTPRHVNRILETLQTRNASTWRQFGQELDACRTALGLNAMA